MLSIQRLSPLIFLLALSLAGCKKKEIEPLPIIHMSHSDISLPTDKKVTFIEFPTATTGFVICRDETTAELFKTTDGGQTWELLQGPVNCDDDEVFRLAFSDDSRGILQVKHTAYLTYDGGETWNAISNGISNKWVLAAGMDHEGNFVYVESPQPYYYVVQRTTPGVDIFEECNSFQTFELNSNDRGSCVADSMVYFATTYGDSHIYGYDFVHDQFISLSYWTYEIVTNVIHKNGKTIVSMAPALIYTYQGESIVDVYEPQESNGSSVFYDYNCVGFIGDYIVAAGDRYIVTNKKKGQWDFVFQDGKNTFTEVFTAIRGIDASSFFLGGENGLLWRATLDY